MDRRLLLRIGIGLSILLAAIVVAVTVSATGEDEPPVETCLALTNGSKLTSYDYTIDGGSPVSDLGGNTHQGAHIVVNFSIADNCELELSLVSYNTESDHNLDTQTVFDSATGTFGEGTHSLEIDLPDCFYQVDFVFGEVITEFNPRTYHGEGRFIDGDVGGENACEEPCRDNPQTTEDECNPCVDDAETTEDECNPCVDDTETTEDECNPCVDDTETTEDECETEIPFFPTPASLAMGLLGTAAIVGIVVMRRRSA